ncbi:MAG: P-loop NTPase [Phycisphaerae bacterium]
MTIVVAFISQKGGVGKSTLARALAAVAAHAGVAVGIADLDPRQNTVMHWQRTRTESGHTPTVAVRSFATLEDALAWKPELDLLIIDTPAGVHRGTLEIARYAHLVVQPSGASIDDLHPAVLLFHELIAAGIPKSRLVVALMRTMTKREEDAARTYIADASYAVLPGSIPERAAFRHAQNVGQALNETDEQSLNDRVDALMQALLDKVASEVATLSESQGTNDKEGAA